MTLMAALLAVLAGCWPPYTRLGPDVTASDAPAAQDEVAGELRFKPPADVPADLATTYRFAHGDEFSVQVLTPVALTQPLVKVDPDGQFACLGLRGVPAVGRTVAELRVDLTARLGELYRQPVVSIQPLHVLGHRYYVLGQVADQGAFPLDRPLTIIDAVARARGLLTGVQNNITIETVDFERAFLMRGRRFIPIDFQALVQGGDLRWNIHIHPGDVLSFPSTLSSEVFVLGAVGAPGAQPFSSGLTITNLLARRGGLLEQAHRHQLVVVRGNLGHPRIFTVNIDKVLGGLSKDFPLQPGDIVYIPDRPFQYVRQLALLAIRTFVGTLAGNVADELANDVGLFNFDLNQ